MTRHFADDPAYGAICESCGHDLEVVSETRDGRRDSDGHVYCTNQYCRYNGEAHPTKDKLNKPRGAAA